MLIGYVHSAVRLRGMLRKLQSPLEITTSRGDSSEESEMGVGVLREQ